MSRFIPKMNPKFAKQRAEAGFNRDFAKEYGMKLMKHDKNKQVQQRRRQKRIGFPPATMGYAIVIVSVTLSIGCNKVVSTLEDDSAEENTLMAQHAGHVVADTDTTESPVYCGLSECAESEICCFANQQCFDPKTGNCGIIPEGATDSDNTAQSTDIDTDTEPAALGEACNSNADCAPEAFCNATWCLGPGTCQLRNAGCMGKKPLPSAPDELKTNSNYLSYLEYTTLVCGCDGRNYESECAAYAHGVRVPGIDDLSPCGGLIGADEFFGDDSVPQLSEIEDIKKFSHELCNPYDDMCEAGRFCCSVTFTCMPNEEKERCFVPETPGYPCTKTFSNCNDSNSNSGLEMCNRPNCADKGVCTPIHFDCNELAPVCGCNGISYMSICNSDNENVSVAYEGECVEQ